MSHVITSSYNHFIMMTNRWPYYGPCFLHYCFPPFSQALLAASWALSAAFDASQLLHRLPRQSNSPGDEFDGLCDRVDQRDKRWSTRGA